MEDFLIDGGRLVIPGGLWFIGPKDYERDLLFVCQSLVNVGTAEDTLVAAFTDEDLARRFIERMREKDLVEPFRPKDPEALGVLLKGLEALGHTHLSVDAGESSDWRISIRDLIAWCHGQT